MFLIDKIAEQKIAEAIRRGELDNLPGTGERLQLDDDSLVPETLRVGYRLLKNSGYLPPQLQLHHEINSVEVLISQARSQEERDLLSSKLQKLLLQLNLCKPDCSLLSNLNYLTKFKQQHDS